MTFFRAIKLNELLFEDLLNTSSGGSRDDLWQNMNYKAKSDFIKNYINTLSD
jgi:hypothetical protein